MMPRTRPPYALEFRRQLVELVRAGGSSGDLVKGFELTAQSICNWVCQADLDEGRHHDGLRTDEREELRRVRREKCQIRLKRFRPSTRWPRCAVCWVCVLERAPCVAGTWGYCPCIRTKPDRTYTSVLVGRRGFLGFMLRSGTLCGSKARGTADACGQP
jgi:transposase